MLSEQTSRYLGEILTFSQTMEVATARVYNWDVGQRRKEKPDEKDAEEEAKEIAQD